MNVRLRPYQAKDFDFARQLYFQTMRWAIERLFGWDQGQQEKSFEAWFNPDEVSIIVADEVDIGWIQQRLDHDAIFLGSIYIAPRMQRKGIGTRVIQTILDLARQQSRPVTLAVMKINPVLAIYESLGFRITHEDEHKFYMRSARRRTSLQCRITGNTHYKRAPLFWSKVLVQATNHPERSTLYD